MASVDHAFAQIADLPLMYPVAYARAVKVKMSNYVASAQHRAARRGTAQRERHWT